MEETTYFTKEEQELIETRFSAHSSLNRKKSMPVIFFISFFLLGFAAINFYQYCQTIDRCDALLLQTQNNLKTLHNSIVTLEQSMGYDHEQYKY